MTALAVVNALALIILVGVTAFYAKQTKRMADEMRRAREATLLPKITLDLHFLGGIYATVAIENVGLGPALDVDVLLRFEPTGDGVTTDERPWKDHVMVPGESHSFDPPEVPNATGPNAWTESYPYVTLAGWASDALGTRHEIQERIATYEVWQVKDAIREYAPADYEANAAQSLKKLTRAVEEIAKTVKGISR